MIQRLTRIGILVLIALAVVYLGSLVDFIFTPFLTMASVVFIPVMIAGFFYYLLRPIVLFLENRRWKRGYAILLIYLGMLLLIIVFMVGLLPSLRMQLLKLVDSVPTLLMILNNQLQEWGELPWLSKWLPDNFSPISNVTSYLNQGFMMLTNSVTSFISFISNFAVVLFIVPVLLFYMLKEGHKFKRSVTAMVPKRYRKEMMRTLTEMDQMLSNYIIGRVIVNLALGVLMLLGFWILNLPYALLLTLVAVLFNFIPLFGPILSAIPIVIIGLIQSPSTGIWALIVILATQQIQDNLISPYVFGKTMDIHPLTTIFLVLAGGKMFGIVGMLVVVPVYMLIKILWKKSYRLFFQQHWETL